MCMRCIYVKIKQIGHVDFYPNGGYPHQPGCENEGSFSGYKCSHHRANVSYYVLGQKMWYITYMPNMNENYSTLYSRSFLQNPLTPKQDLQLSNVTAGQTSRYKNPFNCNTRNYTLYNGITIKCDLNHLFL